MAPRRRKEFEFLRVILLKERSKTIVSVRLNQPNHRRAFGNTTQTCSLGTEAAELVNLLRFQKVYTR